MTSVEHVSRGPDQGDAVWLTLPVSAAGPGASLLAAAATDALKIDDVDLVQRLAALLTHSAETVTAGRWPADAHVLVELGLEFDNELGRLTVASTMQEGSLGDELDETLSNTAAATLVSGAADRLELVPGRSMRATLELNHRGDRSLAGEQAGFDISFHGPLFVREIVPRALLNTPGDGGVGSVLQLGLLGDGIATAILEHGFNRLRFLSVVRDQQLLIRLRYVTEEQADSVAAVVADQFASAEVRKLNGGPDARPAEVVCALPLTSEPIV